MTDKLADALRDLIENASFDQGIVEHSGGVECYGCDDETIRLINNAKQALTAHHVTDKCDALVKALERLTTAQKDLSDHANHHDFAPDDKVAEIEEAYRVAVKTLKSNSER